jgi:hypothetical protein
MECPICLEPMDTSHVMLECCNQPIHRECYINTIRHNPHCPLCRAQHIIIDMVEQPVQSQKSHFFIACFAFSFIGSITYLFAWNLSSETR